MAGTDLSVRDSLRAMPFAMVPQQYAHPGLSANQIGAIIWAHRKLTLAIALCVFSISVIVVRLLPRSYEATASLIINYEVNDPLGGKDFPVGLLGSYVATQIELMQSPMVLMKVVERLHLTNLKPYASGYKGDGTTLSEWAEKVLAKNLTVEQGRFGSQLIYVSYTADNPAEAAQVANAVADVYTEEQHLRQTGPASDRARRYTALLDDLKAKVSRAQEQVTEFRQRTGLLDSDSRIDIDMELLSTLQQRLVEAQNARRAAEAAGAQNGALADKVLSSSLIQSLKTQLADQESRMAESRATLGARHPEVLALQQQLDSTRSSLSRETQHYTGGASSDLAAARQLEQKLKQAVDEQHAKVLIARSLHDEQGKYLVELESAQSVYKRALDGYDQIMFASNDHYSNVDFVGRATTPLRASKPKTLKFLLAALISGLGLGFGLPALYELFINRRIRCRDDLERDYGIPVLAEFHDGRRLGAAP